MAVPLLTIFGAKKPATFAFASSDVVMPFWVKAFPLDVLLIPAGDIGYASDRVRPGCSVYGPKDPESFKLSHALVTHHLPIFFPEAERYLHSSRASWGISLLRFAPCPAVIRRYPQAAFIAAASEHVRGQKTHRHREVLSS